MTKRLVAKTGEYTNQQGEQKGEYVKVGVLMQGNDGEYMLLDPTINLAGVLAKQNVLALNQNKPMRDSVMVSVYENDNQQQGQQQQGGWGQPNQPQQQQNGHGNQRGGNNSQPF